MASKNIGKGTKRRHFSSESRYYIDRNEYSQELINYKKTGIFSERLQKLFILHVERCSTAANFKGYTYRDEMEAHALYSLTRYSKAYDPKKKNKYGEPTDAFIYCTTIIHRAFIQIIHREKKQANIKQGLMNLRRHLRPEDIHFSQLDKMEENI